MYGRRAKGWVTSWTDDGRIPPHVSLLESAASRKCLKAGSWVFCVMLNTTFLCDLGAQRNIFFLFWVWHTMLKVEGAKCGIGSIDHRWSHCSYLSEQAERLCDG